MLLSGCRFGFSRSALRTVWRVYLAAGPTVSLPTGSRSAPVCPSCRWRVDVGGCGLSALLYCTAASDTAASANAAGRARAEKPRVRGAHLAAGCSPRKTGFESRRAGKRDTSMCCRSIRIPLWIKRRAVWVRALPCSTVAASVTQVERVRIEVPAEQGAQRIAAMFPRALLAPCHPAGLPA